MQEADIYCQIHGVVFVQNREPPHFRSLPWDILVQVK